MVAAADEHTVGATVTINEFISSSISGGVAFGSLNPGQALVPAAGQSDNVSAVIVTVEAETNVLCDITIKGSGNFSDNTSTYFMPLGSAKWNNVSNSATAPDMDTVAAQVGQFTNPGTATPFDVWHWITIPDGQVAAAYSTDFIYTVDKTP